MSNIYGLMAVCTVRGGTGSGGGRGEGVIPFSSFFSFSVFAFGTSRLLTEGFVHSLPNAFSLITNDGVC